MLIYDGRDLTLEWSSKRRKARQGAGTHLRPCGPIMEKFRSHLVLEIVSPRNCISHDTAKDREVRHTRFMLIKDTRSSNPSLNVM